MQARFRQGHCPNKTSGAYQRYIEEGAYKEQERLVLPVRVRESFTEEVTFDLLEDEQDNARRVQTHRNKQANNEELAPELDRYTHVSPYFSLGH